MPSLCRGRRLVVTVEMEGMEVVARTIVVLAVALAKGERWLEVEGGGESWSMVTRVGLGLRYGGLSLRGGGGITDHESLLEKTKEKLHRNHLLLSDSDHGVGDSDGGDDDVTHLRCFVRHRWRTTITYVKVYSVKGRVGAQNQIAMVALVPGKGGGDIGVVPAVMAVQLCQ
ncbi:hypothetical protein Acr_01g0004270 [Actinidia rufa]|uniref:Uncharacterized protein n=1 Tax=Actinidia rufa TaxID=165716 RepID=A0A7J0E2I8_9ERIC|nr:hypothetical protein Acr_01g0004270 [Actinidia rufa]